MHVCRACHRLFRCGVLPHAFMHAVVFAFRDSIVRPCPVTLDRSPRGLDASSADVDLSRPFFPPSFSSEGIPSILVSTSFSTQWGWVSQPGGVGVEAMDTSSISFSPNPPPFRWDPCSFGSPSFGGKGQDQVRLLRHVNVTVASAVVVEDPSTRDTRYETNEKERRRLPRERDKDQRRINTTQETSPFQTNEKKRNEDGNGGYTLQTQRNTRG